MSQQAVLIISGYNQRAVVAFLRTLEKTGTPYAIIASRPDDTIFLTAYKDKVAATRSKKELDLDDFSRCIHAAKEKFKFEEFIVAPSTEALNRYLLDHREDFEGLSCHVPLVGKELYEQISDKHSFGELCKSADILVPAEYEELDRATIPFVAKPRKYFAADGNIHTPALIRSKNDLEQFRAQHSAGDFYYQEFVAGESLYLLYYFYKDGSVAKLSQQNFVQQPGGKSMVAAVTSDFHRDPESGKYEKLFKSLGFNGLVMVEVKQDAGKQYMIEANPRFWGPSQLFVDAGVNFFESFLYDNGLRTEMPEFGEDIATTDYFWFGGIAETIQSHGKLTYHTISSDDLANRLQPWLQADVYNRDDTRELFITESGLTNDN